MTAVALPCFVAVTLITEKLPLIVPTPCKGYFLVYSFFNIDKMVHITNENK
jgi:hypothetical protein